MNLHRLPRLSLRCPVSPQAGLLLSLLLLFTTFVAPRPATAQVAQVGSGQTVPLQGVSGLVLGTDLDYDPVNHVYLVVMSYGKTWGHFVNTSGQPVGSPFRIGASDSCPWGNYPRVKYSSDANNGAGGFLVVWHQELSCGGSNRLFGQMAAYPSGVISDARQLSSTAPNTTQRAAIAYSNTSHRFLVAWTSLAWTIDGIGLDANGAPISPVATIVNANAQYPALTWNSATDFFGLGYAGWNSSAFVNFKRVRASDGAVFSNSGNFGVSAGTFVTDVDYNSTTGRFIMGWSRGSGSNGAEISSDGQVLASGLISTRVGTAQSFGARYNPQSGTLLAISEDSDSLDVAGLEMNGNGSPNTAAGRVTTGAGTGSFFPILAARTDAKHWSISYSKNYTTLTNQIISTTSSNGGGSGTFSSPPPTGGGGGGGGGGTTTTYTLTITSPTGGTISTAGITCGVGGTTCTTTYSSGFPVALTATAASGYTFGSWSGDCAPNGTTSMTANRTCSATFNATSGGGSGGGGGGTGPFTLTITQPTGGTISTAGINCGVGGSTCTTQYASGFQVALNATAASGYTFGGWTGDCSSNGTTTMTANRTCGAVFNNPNSGTYTLTINKPTGGTLTTAGINCGTNGNTCSTTFASGFQVSLTATAASGYTFGAWTGDCVNGATTMSTNRTCGATFNATSGGGSGGSGPFTLTITPPTGGKIVTAGVNCGLGSSTCSTQYAAGFPVALTATAGSGYTFGGWTGDCVNGTTSMTQDRTCGATFNSTSGGGGGTFTLTIASPTGGTITTAGINCGVGGSTCSTSFASGFQVTLTATPASGYVFSAWTGDCASGGTTTMSQNRSCGATFTPTGGGSGPFTLTINNPSSNGTGGANNIIWGSGINCFPGNVGPCSKTMSAGSTQTLSQITVSGWVFTGWSGAGCSNNITMTGNLTCTPVFTKQ